MGADNLPKTEDFFKMTDYFDYKQHFDASQVVGDALKAALGF